jgi:phosphoribosylamine---glycine ligase
MNVLVVGSGGREHALVWKLKQSPTVGRLYCAPGNAGIAELAELVPIRADDLEGLRAFAKDRAIDLTVVGPENPLVHGIVDLFTADGLAIFGPTRAAARLEGSKVFSKEFMVRHKIPTARFSSFEGNDSTPAERFLQTMSLPVVVKADGLAAGKGVLICTTRAEAVDAVRHMMLEKAFGEAGRIIVIEEFLQGEEVSVFAISDGERFALLAPAQDHKRIFDGDKGKNTGGMGAYAPAPILTPELKARVVREIVRPTLDGMRSEGTAYRGCLYVGLMLTADGPKVLEYNCRFGDPETQVVVPLIDGDLATILHAAATGRLDPSSVGIHGASAVTVVMASRGYPDAYDVGKEIRGLDAVSAERGEVVFHAGTRREGSRIVSAGGRVLAVTAIGYSHELESTIADAYRIVHRIAFDGAYYRSDIGKKALKAVSQSRPESPSKGGA